MLKRTRVTGTPDVARLGAALERPGIDPRMNFVVGVVESFVVDKDHGVFADVFILNAAGNDESSNVVGQVLTCRVGSFYGGQGWGFYAPLLVDDEVAVGIPVGDPDHGPVVLAKLWSPSELQPAEANDHPADVVLHVEKDKTLRIVATGNGNVVVGAADGKVLLGSEDNTKPVGRKGDPVNMGTWTHVPAAGVGVTPCKLLWSGPGAVGPPSEITLAVELDGDIKDGSGKVESS